MTSAAAACVARPSRHEASGTCGADPVAVRGPTHATAATRSSDGERRCAALPPIDRRRPARVERLADGEHGERSGDRATTSGISVRSTVLSAGHLRRHERSAALVLGDRIRRVADDVDRRRRRRRRARSAGRGSQRPRRRRRRRSRRSHDDAAAAPITANGRSRDERRDEVADEQLAALDRERCRCGPAGRSPARAARAPRVRGRTRGRRRPTSIGVVPRDAAIWRADRGDREDRHPHDAPGGEAQQAVPAATPHAPAMPPSPASEPHPRPAAGALVGQLAAQQDHRAQVLHRDGEPQLRDEAAAPGERVERRPRRAARPRRPRARRSARARRRSTGRWRIAPQREAAVEVRRTGDVRDAAATVCHASPIAAITVATTSGSRRAWATSARADPQQRRVEAEQRTAAEPRERRSREPPPGELTGDGTDTLRRRTPRCGSAASPGGAAPGVDRRERASRG